MVEQEYESMVGEESLNTLLEQLRERINSSGLSRKYFKQLVTENGDALVADVLALVRERVDFLSGRIVRRANVDPSGTLPQLIEATGRRQFVDPDVLATAPRGAGGEVELDYVNFGVRLTPQEIDARIAKDFPGYRLAHLDEITADQVADPAFAYTHPCGTQWWDSKGKACYVLFPRWAGERYVLVDRNDSDWDVDWWFPLVRIGA